MVSVHSYIHTDLCHVLAHSYWPLTCFWLRSVIFVYYRGFCFCFSFFSLPLSSLTWDSLSLFSFCPIFSLLLSLSFLTRSSGTVQAGLASSVLGLHPCVTSLSLDTISLCSSGWPCFLGSTDLGAHMSTLCFEILIYSLCVHIGCSIFLHRFFFYIYTWRLSITTNIMLT